MSNPTVLKDITNYQNHRQSKPSTNPQSISPAADTASAASCVKSSPDNTQEAIPRDFIDLTSSIEEHEARLISNGTAKHLYKVLYYRAEHLYFSIFRDNEEWGDEECGDGYQRIGRIGEPIAVKYRKKSAYFSPYLQGRHCLIIAFHDQPSSVNELEEPSKLELRTCSRVADKIWNEYVKPEERDDGLFYYETIYLTLVSVVRGTFRVLSIPWTMHHRNSRYAGDPMPDIRYTLKRLLPSDKIPAHFIPSDWVRHALRHNIRGAVKIRATEKDNPSRPTQMDKNALREKSTAGEATKEAGVGNDGAGNTETDHDNPEVAKEAGAGKEAGPGTHR